MIIGIAFFGTKASIIEAEVLGKQSRQGVQSFVSVRAFCPQRDLGTLRYCKRQEVENVASIRLLVAVADLHL